jgi:hypothetical protein
MFFHMKAVKFEERERIQTAFDGNFKDRNSPESMLLASAASAQDGYMKFIWLYEEIDSMRSILVLDASMRGIFRSMRRS